MHDERSLQVPSGNFRVILASYLTKRQFIGNMAVASYFVLVRSVQLLCLDDLLLRNNGRYISPIVEQT